MIAVTGGSGFLGRHLLKSLRDQGKEFVALVRSNLSSEILPAHHQRILDFRNPQALREALEGADQLVHLAGRINGSTAELSETNVELTRQLIAAAKKTGVRRFIFMSSVAAHDGLGPYGKTKREAEEILKASGVSYLILRSSLIFGAGDTKNVSLMEQWIRKSPVVPLLGGGKFMLQPVYVDDVVSALLKASGGRIENRTYNLAGPAQISLKEMIEVLAEGLKKKPFLLPIPLKPIQVLARIGSFLFPSTRLPTKQILELHLHQAFNTQDTQRDFGFLPRSFRDGIQAMQKEELLCAG